MNNVIPDTIFDKTGEVIDTIAAHRNAADKACRKAARAYNKAEYAPELYPAVEAASALSNRLMMLQKLLQSAMDLALGFDDIKEDPTGDFTALATEYAGLLDRITTAVAAAHDNLQN